MKPVLNVVIVVATVLVTIWLYTQMVENIASLAATINILRPTGV